MTDAELKQLLEANAERIEQRVDIGFADTQAMIKFSHAELERRVRTLEDGFAELQARVERLESTTH